MNLYNEVLSYITKGESKNFVNIPTEGEDIIRRFKTITTDDCKIIPTKLIETKNGTVIRKTDISDFKSSTITQYIDGVKNEYKYVKAKLSECSLGIKEPEPKVQMCEAKYNFNNDGTLLQCQKQLKITENTTQAAEKYGFYKGKLCNYQTKFESVKDMPDKAHESYTWNDDYLLAYKKSCTDNKAGKDYYFNKNLLTGCFTINRVDGKIEAKLDYDYSAEQVFV